MMLAVAGALTTQAQVVRDQVEKAQDRQQIAEGAHDMDRDADELAAFQVQLQEFGKTLQSGNAPAVEEARRQMIGTMSRELAQARENLADDKREVRQSTSEVRSEQRDIRRDKAAGERANVARDRADKRDDKRDLRDDKADRLDQAGRVNRMDAIISELRSMPMKQRDMGKNHPASRLCIEFEQLMKAELNATNQELKEDKRELHEDHKETREDRRKRARR